MWRKNRIARGGKGRMENIDIFVNVYMVTREYGGSEEGGWWYNDYECIESVKTDKKSAQETKEILEEEYKDEEYGDIYSVRGGVLIEVLIEEKERESDTRRNGVPRFK